MYRMCNMPDSGYRIPEPDFDCRIPDSEICFPCAVFRAPFANGTLNLDEIWHDCAMGYGTYSCQISSKSTVPFVRYYGLMDG